MTQDRYLRTFSANGVGRRALEPRKLPKLIERLRDYALVGFEKAFAHMLDTADDTLFDLADKSASNRDQSQYFDAMRELRIKRKGMENVFRQELYNAFHQLSGPVAAEADERAQTYNLDALTLVKEDELEENLAIDAMVNRARTKNEEALRFLARRFDSVVPEVQVEPENIPVGPKQVCESFRVAANTLTLDLKSRLVVYKLFERGVCEQLADIYEDLNNFLADNGVLPDLHIRKPRRQPAPAASRAKAPAGGAFDSATEDADAADGGVDIKTEVFNALRELLATRKATPLESEAGLGMPLMPLIETPQLLQALSNLQHDPRGAAPLMSAQELRQSLASRLPVVGGGRVDAQAVGSVNDDVIDIVSMLFDFILGDSNLSDDIKAQIGRLQIPMLKVALVDKTFFSNRNHPARLLLNEMAYAGIGWDPERRGRDGLQGKIEGIVQRVLNDFDDDMRLFDELLADFRAYVEEERRRAAILEKRTREAEEGRARTEAAKLATDAVLQRLIGEQSLPPIGERLLHDVWSKVLLLEHLRGGEDGEGFRTAVVVAEDLVRSIRVRSQAEKAQLPQLLPSLVKRLRAGFEAISYGAIEASALLHELERVHLTVLRMQFPPAATVPAPVPAAVADIARAPASPSGITTSGATPAKTDAPFVVEADVPPSTPVSRETDLLADLLPDPTEEDAALLAALDIEPAAAERVSGADENEIVLGTPEPVVESPVDETALAQVDALPVGAWVELREGDKPLRAKLAAKIPNVGKLIFVNRSGMKVAEFTRPGFAVALKRGGVKLLDDAALFDRALEAVIGNLRKLKDAADA